MKLRLTLAAFVIAGCMAGASAADKVVIQTDWQPGFSHAGLYAAKMKGYFDEAGLEVQLLDGNGGSAAVQLVGAGQADAGWASIATVAFARSNGVPVKSIATYMRASENAMIVPRGVQNLKELEGKAIVTTATGGVTPFLDTFINAAGSSRDKFNVITVDFGAIYSTYMTGQADALLSGAVSAIPEVSHARESDYITFDEVGLKLPGYGLFTRDEVLEEKADVLRRLVEAVGKGWEYALNGNEEEVIDEIIALNPGKQFDRNRDTWVEQVRLLKPFFYTESASKDLREGRPLGWHSQEEWSATLDLYRSVGFAATDARPEDYFTNELFPAP